MAYAGRQCDLTHVVHGSQNAPHNWWHEIDATFRQLGAAQKRLVFGATSRPEYWPAAGSWHAVPRRDTPTHAGLSRFQAATDTTTLNVWGTQETL